MAGGTTVLVGTTKGAFLLKRDHEAAGWDVSGPHCDGWPINHVIGDPDGGTIWAAGGGDWHGSGVWRSMDHGKSWTLCQLATGQQEEWVQNDPETAQRLGVTPSPPAPFTGDITALWSLGRVGGRLFAGAKPAALYVSDDGGEAWSLVRGLTDHPSREEWFPGAAGLVLHTILGDPDDPAKLWVGISAAGVFATEDGGATWERRNRRANADGGAASNHPASGSADEIGYCVHNIQRARAAGGDLLYQQNHHGVFRSPDGGRSWQDITGGLPSTFGFPIAVDPDNPETIWVLPLNGDSAGRYPPDAAAAVWRSVDGGATWEAKRNGLPQTGCFFTVLRQAMAIGGDTSAGLYFGTNTGSVFASHDAGESWSEIARHLPTVLSVEVLSPA